MTTTTRPLSSVPSLLGGSIESPEHACLHALPARSVSPWTGEPGTAGRVAVVGAGKMGLPLAAQFASHGWHVVAVDVQPAVVAAINEGRSHVTEEPGLAEAVQRAHAAGRLTATLDAAEAARTSDVVVIIVPVMLDDEQQPDYRYMDAAVASIAPGIHAGSTVIFETTLPVGDTRNRYAPRLEEASGLAADADFFVAFSPERLYSGAVFRNLAAYPKLVGGIGAASTERAVAFYESVLDADVVPMSSAEAAEFSKLADTTYRDVNIALANEFARYADRVGVDIQEVIAGANSQPYSHIHQPGLGVGGHCIPVYPHFLLSRAPEMELVGLSRRVNDGQVGVAIRAIQKVLGGLEGVPVLVLGPDLPRRRPRARLLAGHAAHRAPRVPRRHRVGLGSAPRRRGDRPILGDALALGRAEPGPGDRDPDRRSAVPRARPRLVPGPRAGLRRPQQPARDGASGRGHLPGRRGPGARAPAGCHCRRLRSPGVRPPRVTGTASSGAGWPGRGSA